MPDSEKITALVWRPFSRKRRLIVSRGAIEQLDPMALRWLLAHELGHVADDEGRRRMRLAAPVGTLACFLLLLLFALIPGPLGVVLGWPVIIALHVVGARLRRALERAADRTAYRLCATDPDAGRRALTAVRESSGMRPDRVFRAVQAIGGYPPWRERLTPATE